MPPAIAAAARAFAAELRARGEILDDEWLNDGPGSLAAQLLPAWQARTRPVFTGSALRLSTLGREDLLGSKLFALCDRGIDLGDCLALAPTAEELLALLPWVEQQDTNPDWPGHVRATLTDLASRLGHAL